jgi:beta-phosphoglucomutase-like phosphatase (HAD superfamily)
MSFTNIKIMILFVTKRGQGVNKFTLIGLEFEISFLYKFPTMNPENSIQKENRFKPFPDPYLKAIQKIQQKPMNCLVVENAPAGIQSAFSAGIPCFAISSTLPSEKFFGADHFFLKLKSLTSYFNKILF